MPLFTLSAFSAISAVKLFSLFSILLLDFLPSFLAWNQRVHKIEQKVHFSEHFDPLLDQKARKSAQNRTFSKTAFFALTPVR